MDKEKIKWILELIESEIGMKITDRYSGNIEFQVNMFEGGIGNLGIATKRTEKFCIKKKIIS